MSGEFFEAPAAVSVLTCTGVEGVGTVLILSHAARCACCAVVDLDLVRWRINLFMVREKRSNANSNQFSQLLYAERDRGSHQGPADTKSLC